MGIGPRLVVIITAVLTLTGDARAQRSEAAPIVPAPRLPSHILDVASPSSRVRGLPGNMAVQARPCPSSARPDAQRIVDIAAQEWGFFGFRLAQAAEGGDNDQPFPVEPRQRRRPRLPPEEAARVAGSIAGYWAVTAEGSWIVARQNERWSGIDGVAARWNAPWSAAFISWVMCEAGLSSASQFQRAIAHHTYIDQAIRARDGRAAQAAFVAHDAGEADIAPGDLLCSSRRPAYRSIADRRRQMGTGARSHCDIVVKVDQTDGRVLAIGGNVRGVVSLKVLPTTRIGSRLKAHTGNEERPLFAHLKLRAAAVTLSALDSTPTVAQLLRQDPERLNHVAQYLED